MLEKKVIFRVQVIILWMILTALFQIFQTI